MVPFAERPVRPPEAVEFEGDPARPVEADPARRLVHVALALYLTPVILVVYLIGAISIILGKATKLASHPPHRDKDGHWLAAGAGVEKGRRPGDGRERTRVGH